MQAIDVTYYMHSGFSYAVNDTLLIFDYWEGEGRTLPEQRRLTTNILKDFKEVYVFISHSHPDHYDPVVYEWGNVVPITYIIGNDLPLEVRGNRLNPGETMTFNEHITVRAFDSTDLGVSFLVDIAGMHVFHAGDLNFWHWREESTAREIDEAEEAFHAAVAPIIGQPIDLAFFPVDARQGMLYDAGANYFMMSVKPRIMIPMHFWEKAEIATEFARRSRNSQTEIIAMTRPGEMLQLDVEDDGFINVNVVDPEPLPAPKTSASINMNSFERDDPFADSDMPVNLDR